MAGIFRQLISAVLFGSIIYSCASQREAKYKYAKKPFDLDSSYRVAESRSEIKLARLDVDTYYYRFDSTRTVFSHQGTYHILKFYSDGRVQAASAKTLSDKNLKTEQKLTPQDFDYYKIDGETIRMEFWRDKLAKMGYWKGVVYSDSIVFNKVNNVLDKYVYIKKK